MTDMILSVRPPIGLLCAVALLCGVAHGEDHPAGDLFDRLRTPRLEIRLADGAADRLRGDPRGYVPCTITVDGDAVHDDVAIRLKGSAGSFQGLDERPAFTVNMDRFSPGSRLEGLDKFHLNNSVQDPTLLHELLGAGLFTAAGIPAARVTHARVILDDRDLGVYVLKEAMDRDFLARHVERTDGNLYDGGTGVDLDQLSERDEGKRGVPGADLAALVAACRLEDPAERREAIDAKLDVDSFLTFMAIELMAGHWDGYTPSHNNYRVYVDPGDGDRARFLPHGMDQLFGDPGAPILDLPPTIVAAAVMGVPAWRESFRDRVRELLPLFDADGRLLPEIEAAAGRIRPTVADLGAEALAAWEEALVDLRQRIVARDEHLRGQADAPEPEPIQFDGARRAVIGGWSPRLGAGDALLEEIDDGTGRRAYRIAVAGESPASASWRVAVPLPTGRYILEGIALGEGIAPVEDERGGGAGLRISGRRRDGALATDVGWEPLAFEFTLDAPTMVELVAELHASAGSVLFNAESLALRQLSCP